MDLSSGINAWLPLPFGRFRFSISLLGLCFFFSPLPVSPSQWVFRCSPVPFVPFDLSFRSACFHASLPVSVLSFPAFPFATRCFRITGATSAAGLLFPARPFPLAFALGSGYLAVRCTLKTEHCHFILQSFKDFSLSLRFGQAFGLLVSVSYTHCCASTSDLSTT